MISGKLEDLEKRFEQIEADMARPAAISNIEEYKKLSREHAQLRELVTMFREWKKVGAELEKTQEMMHQETEEEMRDLAKEEAALLEKENERLESLLKGKLLSKDEGDDAPGDRGRDEGPREGGGGVPREGEREARIPP